MKPLTTLVNFPFTHVIEVRFTTGARVVVFVVFVVFVVVVVVVVVVDEVVLEVGAVVVVTKLAGNTI